MSERPFELAWTAEGMVARVRLRGSSVLYSPMLNRGTAFTLAEREALGLTGLLPDGVSTIEGQLRRVYAQYLRQPDDLAKNLYLGNSGHITSSPRVPAAPPGASSRRPWTSTF